MFALFFYHRNFMFVILTLLLCSIICQILLGVTYHRLIRETENMSVTKNKSIQPAAEAMQDKICQLLPAGKRCG